MVQSLSNIPRYSAAPRLHRKRRFFGAVCVSLALFLGTGCALVGKPREKIPCDPTEVVRVLEERSRRIQSFLSTGELVLELPRGEHRGRFVLAFLKPDLAFVKIYSPASAPVMYYTVNGDETVLLDFVQQNVVRDKSRSGVLRLNSGVDLPLNVVLAGITGDVEILPHRMRQCREVDASRRLLVTLSQGRQGGHTQLIYVIPETHQPSGLELRKDGAPEMAMVFEDHTARSGVLVPSSIQVDIPGRLARIRLFQQQVWVNPDLSPSHFVVEIPDGFDACGDAP